METEWVWFRIYAETEKAWQGFDGGETLWIPQRQIREVDSQPAIGETVRFELPAWLVNKNGMSAGNRKEDVEARMLSDREQADRRQQAAIHEAKTRKAAQHQYLADEFEEKPR